MWLAAKTLALATLCLTTCRWVASAELLSLSEAQVLVCALEHVTSAF